MLTAVNLLLRAVGTGFHVYLSRRIGAAGIGLLQLVLSVDNLATVAGIAGIRTAAMYLTAEELGRGKPQHIPHILSGCYRYSLCFSCSIGLALYLGAPFLARVWIGNPQTVPAMRVFSAFLPIICLCGVLTGYFTAEKRIGTLAAVEVAEQLFTMAVTLLTLTLWAGMDAQRACLSVIFGSGLGTCLTFLLLVFLRCREPNKEAAAFPLRQKLLQTALPLAGADVVRSGISTTENLLVPKRLRLFSGEADPLAAFGRISGMVFPVMMFPACILFALAELLIPELAGCKAAGNQKRIRYLVRRSLWAAMIYGILFSGLLFLFADSLCIALYKNAEAGQHLKSYALMVPFLYCDAITDAMTKGMGQQRICVRYNILTSSLDVCMLFFLLPKYGMRGYYLSFLVSHLLNFILSLLRLIRITGVAIPLHIPAYAASAGILGVWGASLLGSRALYLPLCFGLMMLFGVINRTDLKWIENLIVRKTPAAA